MDLRGRLPLLIQNFLPERKFRVRVKTSLADFYDQEMGISQSSMLSVTLFIVKINSFTSYIRNGVDKSPFVDDFGVSHWLKHIERQLQLHLDRIEDWADHNCYKLSQLKSVCVYFCWGTDPYLALYNSPILVKLDTKFNPGNIAKFQFPETPPWTCQTPPSGHDNIHGTFQECMGEHSKMILVQNENCMNVQVTMFIECSELNA